MPIPVISGGIFNFSEAGYLPPTWSGAYSYDFAVGVENEGISCYEIWVETNNGQWTDELLAQWTECSPGVLNQIWTDDYYVYAAIDFGLDIIDIVTEMKIAYIDYNTGFKTVWANDDKIFLGTTNSGIKYLDKTCISGSIMTPYDLGSCLSDYVTPYGITSNNIRYVHGNNDKLVCCTASGVDVFKMDPQGYRSYTTVSGASKCFMTSTGKFYYTTISGVVWSVNRVDTTLVDWQMPDNSYVAGGSLIEEVIRFNDLYVTEGTTLNGISNTLFLATSSGVYVIDEGTQTKNIYYTGGN